MNSIFQINVIKKKKTYSDFQNFRKHKKRNTKEKVKININNVAF